MEKNMQENFAKLNSRVIESLELTDLERIKFELNKISEPTLISGVGGSSVVSEFASKVLNQKNKIITKSIEPRDFKYLHLNGYSNVLACSYSGNNYGVELAFLNNLKHYLLSAKENNNSKVVNLNYYCEDKEHSFISLASTLIPCSILLDYYLNIDLDGKKYIIHELLDEYEYDINLKCDAFEIFTGYDTIASSRYLESTMTESGIGIPIIHDKYSYCHGRSTLSTLYNNIAIYFDTGKELDQLLLLEISKYYNNVINIKSDGSILGDYKTLIKCMYLTKRLAEYKNKDLSGVDYNPIVKKLYKYNGSL